MKLEDDCQPICSDTSHTHGKVVEFKAAKVYDFISTLDGLISVPTSKDVIEKAKYKLKSFEESNSGKKAYIYWPGYFIERFTSADLVLLTELVQLVQTTKHQVQREVKFLEGYCGIPSGLRNLDGLQDKFLHELWYSR